MKVVLIGFMGSGKSTVSALLADRLAVPLIEMDREIIAEAGGIPIPEIFDRHGEPYFRDLESRVAQRYAGASQAVISAGGGTPERAENMQALKSGKVLTVYLEVSFETVLQRLERDGDRPLLRDRERARALHERRDSLYRSHADLIIDGTRSPEQICEIIEQTLAEQR